MMHHLFSGEGLRLLQDLRRHRTLYAFDFDGTLCPIVSDPLHATISPPIIQLLQKLSSSSPVAVISGRSLADLRTRIDCDGIRMVGNHGAEAHALDGGEFAWMQTCTVWSRSLQEWTRSENWPAEAVIEHKGLSISLHYRACVNRESARQKLLALVDGLHPRPRVIGGKCVLNLVPDDCPHKGHALLKLMDSSQCERALFFGDDVTDEDVFSLEDNRVVGVRVTPHSDSHASYFLENQDEISKLLQLLTAKPMAD